MTTSTLDPSLVACLQAAACEVLETMVFLTPERAAEQPAATVFHDAVVGLLSFTGSKNGTVVLRTTERMAKTIAAKMLMMEPEELTSTAEACDGFGELVNMVTGNFKNSWITQGNRMDLSVPTVVLGGEVRLEHSVGSSLRLFLGDEHLDVGLYFATS